MPPVLACGCSGPRRRNWAAIAGCACVARCRPAPTQAARSPSSRPKASMASIHRRSLTSTPDVKFGRLDYTVWAVLGALGLALAVLLALGDRVGARVVGTKPGQGGTVGAYGRLEIEFAQAMITESVAERFSVEPPIAGRWLWEGQRGVFVPATAYQPGTTYTVRLRPGAQAQNGRATREELSWTFTVREPGVGYVSPAGGGPPEVWRSAGGAPGTPVTQTNGRVYDFTVSPDGEQLVYSVVNDQGGIDLWLSANPTPPRLMVDCGFDRCSVPAFAPSSDQLAYSREEQGLSPDAPHGPPRVWLLNTRTGETSPLYQDSQVL